MRLELPFWFWFAYFDVKLWFVTIPAAILLFLIGWYGADWLRWLRWTAFAASALLALPFPAAAALMIFGEIRSAIARSQFERVLDKDETVAGLPLPAGSRINFRDKEHLGVASIEMPRVANIFGISLAGPLVWNVYSQVWSGTLAGDQRIDGWPCHAGPIEFSSGGAVQKCDLAEAHTLLGFSLPAGTNVTRGKSGEPWALRLPPNAGLAVPELSTEAPAGATLFVSGDGRLDRMNSGHGQTIVVRGVPLNSMNFYVRGEQVVAALAEPFPVAGELQPAGTGVEIGLAAGTISLAGKNWWLSK